METLLSFNSVDICFDDKSVVHNVSFSLQPGEILGIVGESGSGKSTIIKAAMGLLGRNGRVSRGEIFFKGDNITDLPESGMRQIRGAQIGMIFQDSAASLCPIRTVGSQIYECLTAHEKISRQEAKEKALDLFHKLGFKEGERVWSSYPFELSGGMNQRVGIVMAMLLNPSVLLADEPTSALDVFVQKQVVLEMLGLRDLFGTAIILVTHDLGVISAMADNILVLQNGNIMEYGRASDVLNSPKNDYTKMLLSAVPKLRRN